MVSLPPRVQPSMDESFDSREGRGYRSESEPQEEEEPQFEEEPQYDEDPRASRGNSPPQRTRSRSRSIERRHSRSRSRSQDAEGLAKYRIQKKYEFASAECAVPPPPKRNKPVKRVRVSLEADAKDELDSWLKGQYLTSQDKQTLVDQIPLPATVLALPASLDDDLKALLGPDQFTGRTIQVSEKELHSLNELAVNAVNMLMFLKKLSASEDSGTHLADDALGYIHATGDILSVAIKDLVGMRRQLALSALGLRVADVPSIRRLPLDGSARLDPKSDEYFPNLFGNVLKEELLASDSAVKKAVDRLKAKNKPSSARFLKDNKKSKPQDRRYAPSAAKTYNRPGCSGNRFFRAQMVSPLKLRLSAVQPNWESTGESLAGAVQSDSSHSTLEKPALVPSTSRRCHRAPAHMPSDPLSVIRSERAASSLSGSGKLPPSNLEGLCLSWQREGLSLEAANTLLAGWSSATLKQYNSALRFWFAFKKSNCIPDSPSIHHLLNYLADLLSKGKSAATISSHKSAICAYYDDFFHTNFRNHPLLARFLKGVFRKRPQLPRYATTWDVSMVLQMLGKWGNNEDLDSSRLVKKLTILFALCSPRRVSELARFSLKDMVKGSGSYTFFINYRNKNRSSGPPHSAIYTSFEDPKLCPVSCLDHYLIRSEEWRSSDFLFLSPVTKTSVTPSTISRWIKEVILEAGIDPAFKAHSTRSATTSLAFKAGVSAAEILKAACWSKNSDTFRRFYLKEDVDSGKFQNSVLSTRPSTSKQGISRPSGSSQRGSTRAPFKRS